MSAVSPVPAVPRLPAPRSRWARLKDDHWAALAVLLAGTFMIVLDFFIVNVALPSMQADLHASHGAAEWFVAGYGLTFAAGLITAGRLGDRFGRRRMFSLGLALFTLASVACAAAQTAGALNLARLVQGLAAALISPQVLSIIGVKYVGADRVRALSFYGVVMGLGAVGGQILGGLLIGADIVGLGWRSVFLINVPIGLVGLVLASRLVPESRAENPVRLDLVGALLVTVGLVALVLPLTAGVRTAGRSGRGCRLPRRRSCWASSRLISAGSPAAAARRYCRWSCLESGHSPLGWRRSWRCGAAKRRSSWSSRCICSRAGTSTRCWRASCSASSRWRSWRRRCARRDGWCATAGG